MAAVLKLMRIGESVESEDFGGGSSRSSRSKDEELYNIIHRKITKRKVLNRNRKNCAPRCASSCNDLPST